jgi:hypothetical protein
MKFKASAMFVMIALGLILSMIGFSMPASAYSYYGPTGYQGHNYNHRPYYDGYYNYGPAAYSGLHYTFGLLSPGYYYNRYYPVNYYYDFPHYFVSSSSYPEYYSNHYSDCYSPCNHWWGW